MAAAHSCRVVAGIITVLSGSDVLVPQPRAAISVSVTVETAGMHQLPAIGLSLLFLLKSLFNLQESMFSKRGTADFRLRIEKNNNMVNISLFIHTFTYKQHCLMHKLDGIMLSIHILILESLH